MTQILFRSSWHWANNGTDVQRTAVSHSGDISVTAADLADAGGRTLEVVGALDRVEFPLQAHDPWPTSWCLHAWMQYEGGTAAQDGGWIGPIDSGGARGIALRGTRNSPAGIRLYHKGSILFGPYAIPNPAHVVLAVTEHPSEGSVHLWVDGSLVYSDESRDTSRDNPPTRMSLGAAGNSFPMRYSHVILTDGENLGGDALVSWMPPSADVAPNEWDKSEATDDHFEHLSDHPHDADVSYLRSPADGNRTRHKFSTSLPTGRRIVGAGIVAVSRLEASSDDRLQVTHHSSAGSPVALVRGVLGTEYAAQSFTALSEDPATSEEWTESALSDMEVEVEHLAPEA